MSINSLVSNVLESPNYNYYKNIENMILYKDGPIYRSFGNVAAMRENLSFINEESSISSSNVGITFKLIPEKYIKGIILEIPECKNEFDVSHYVIVFIGRQMEYYACELMDEDNYALRCNDVQVVKVYDHKPESDEVWNEIFVRYPDEYVPDLYFAGLHVAEDDANYCILFKDNSDFLQHWFDATVCRIALNILGNDYWVICSLQNNNIGILRNVDGSLRSIEESDLMIFDQVFSYCIENIEEIRNKK